MDYLDLSILLDAMAIIIVDEDFRSRFGPPRDYIGQWVFRFGQSPEGCRIGEQYRLDRWSLYSSALTEARRGAVLLNCKVVYVDPESKVRRNDGRSGKLATLPGEPAPPARR